MKLNALADLKAVKKELAERAERARAAAAAQAQQARQQAAAHTLFEAAVGRVERLAPPPLANLRPAPPRPIPRQRALDDAAALQEALSDTLDIDSLLHTDEALSFLRPGVGPDVAQQLRRGKWAIQDQIDLHGLRTDAAREALAGFVREAHRQGKRCVRVVHGKGLGSPGRTPVLKDKVQRWLVQKSEVLAFVQAPPLQGGAGALVVLLQPVRAAA